MGNMFSKSPNTISIKYLNKKSQVTPVPPVPPKAPPAPPMPGTAVGTGQSLQNAINELNASETALKTVLAAIEKTRSMLQQQYEHEKTATNGMTPPPGGPAASITTPQQSPMGTPPPSNNMASLS